MKIRIEVRGMEKLERKLGAAAAGELRKTVVDAMAAELLSMTEANFRSPRYRPAEWAPLADATLKRKKGKRPLVDTGTMIRGFSVENVTAEGAEVVSRRIMRNTTVRHEADARQAVRAGDGGIRLCFRADSRGGQAHGEDRQGGPWGTIEEFGPALGFSRRTGSTRPRARLRINAMIRVHEEKPDNRRASQHKRVRQDHIQGGAFG